MSKKNYKPITKDVAVTRKEILETFRNSKFRHAIESSGCRHALIGGALFKMLGIEYDTQDIDVAAEFFLDWDGEYFTTKGKNSTPGAGHYLVDGTPVEWMVSGKPGSELLFKAAVDNAYLDEETGLWLAPLEIAMAIKLYAGREKDVEMFREFWDMDRINGQLVMDIVEKLTGKTPEI